jgi:ribosome-associated toxin RatA of RatAB toxin-antitoxin module
MAEAEIEIAYDADTAYACLCDIHRVPQWVRGVARVDVIERDEQGRATLARFISMPARASVSYTLRYRYEDQDLRMVWQPEERSERALQGRAQIVRVADDRCRLRYELDVWNAASIPMWARAALREDDPEAIVHAFRRWLERLH